MQRQIIAILGLVAVAALLAATYFGKMVGQSEPEFMANDTNSFRQQIGAPEKAEQEAGQELASESMASEEQARVEAKDMADEEAAAKVELAPPPDLKDVPAQEQPPDAVPQSVPAQKPVDQVRPVPAAEPEPAAKPMVPAKTEPKAEVKPAPKPEPEIDKNLQSGTVINVSFAQEAGRFTMRLALDRPIDKATYFNLYDPKRLALDLHGKWKIASRINFTPDQSIIKIVRYGFHKDRLRFVLDFTESTAKTPTEPVLEKQGNTLVLSIR